MNPRTELSEAVRRLFDGPNFAVLCTLGADGAPHSTVVWVGRENDDLVFALPRDRRKVANLARDPRASVTIFDSTRPYESVMVQGSVVLSDDPEGVLIDELSRTYTGGPYPGFAGPDPDWVTARLTPHRVVANWPGA